MKVRLFSLICVGLLGVAGSSEPVGAQDDAKRSITQIAGDLYRFQNNFHYSVFLVTPQGIIATDTINADAAAWLKAELQKRFGQTVKYLIYSHDHVDHIAGGEVFSDTAIVVAHDQARADIIGEQRPTGVPDITFTGCADHRIGGQISGAKLRWSEPFRQHDRDAISG